jgi:hypothetical protein
MEGRDKASEDQQQQNPENGASNKTRDCSPDRPEEADLERRSS